MPKKIQLSLNMKANKPHVVTLVSIEPSLTSYPGQQPHETTSKSHTGCKDTQTMGNWFKVPSVRLQHVPHTSKLPHLVHGNIILPYWKFKCSSVFLVQVFCLSLVHYAR